jgi:sigma54-dependent transcription regulator
MKQLVQDIVPELNPDVLELKDHLALYGTENMSPVQRKLFDKLNVGPSFHSLQKSAGDVLSASNDLLATYQELNRPPYQQLDDDIKRLRVRWTQNKVEMERLLGVGYQVAQYRLDKMMPKSARVASTSSATVQPIGSDQEVHPIDRQLQQALTRTIRGVYHIVRDLPKQ